MFIYVYSSCFVFVVFRMQEESLKILKEIAKEQAEEEKRNPTNTKPKLPHQQNSSVKTNTSKQQININNKTQNRKNLLKSHFQRIKL